MKRFLKYLIIGTCLLLFTIFNLEANAVYYAQHSRVVKKEAVPFILLDHLWWYIGDNFVEIENHFYEVDGTANIIWDDKDTEYWFKEDTGPDSEFALSVISTTEKRKWYYIDKNFKVISIDYYLDDTPIPVTEEDQQFVQDILPKISKDLLDKTKAPLINLQLIYDLIQLIKGKK